MGRDQALLDFHGAPQVRRVAALREELAPPACVSLRPGILAAFSADPRAAARACRGRHPRGSAGGPGCYPRLTDRAAR